jgi:hypothetical protein
MYSFKPATRGRWRNAGLLCLSLFLSISLYSEAACSASLVVKIKQLNPEGGLQQVTCTDDQKCVLPVDIQTGQTKKTLTVGISFVPGNVLMTFATPDGFLYAGDTNPADTQHAIYETLWHRAVAQNEPSISDVTLFSPAVPNALLVPALSAVEKPVADLEITLETTP